MEVAKFYTKAKARYSNDLMVVGFKQLNQTLSVDFKVVGNAKHICASGAPCNSILALQFHMLF